MDFTHKRYQVLRLKKLFKKNSLLLIIHCSKLNFKKWMLLEQKFKKLKLNYYKPLNKVIFKEFKNSIYYNHLPIVNSFILLVNFSDKNNNFNLNHIEKVLKPLFVITSVKLNHKLYSIQQFKQYQNISYKKNIFKLNKVLNKFLKISYLII